MKLLAVFFILGLALASAVPLSVDDDDFESELDQISDELGDEFIIYAEGGLAQRLRERLEELIEKIKNKFDEGKGVNGDLMKKAEDFYDKLKKLGFELSEKFQNIFEELKKKMGGGNAPEYADFDFREILRKLREKIRENIDIDQLKEQIKERLGKSELGKQLLEFLKDSKAKDKIRDFINRILGDKEAAHVAHSVFLDKLKETFERLVEKMQKASEEGKGVNENMMKKAQDLYDKLTNLHVEISEKVKQIFEDLKNKMQKNAVEHAEAGLIARLRERLENMISRVKKNFDDGKEVKGNVFKKLTDAYEKFKNMGFEVSEKFKSVFEDLRSKLSKNKRSVENADFNFFELFKNLKQLIKDKFDADDLKEKVENLFGKGSEIAEQLVKIIREKGEKGKKGILDWIDRILGEKEEKRSIKEIYEKVKNYFKDLNIELKEKFVKFGEYAKEQYHKVLDKTKTKAENVKEIAKKFVDDGRKISKDLAEEALEFFREYRDDLGTIWVDVHDKVRDILKKD